MPITVAFCTSSPAFAENKILNRTIAAQYPGALWIPGLVTRLALRGITTVTGDIALQRVREGGLRPSEIGVIQDDTSAAADTLIQLGAHPRVLMCCESPLFAANFYRDLPTVSRTFAHCILFRGALDNAHPFIAKHVMHFPSFSLNTHRPSLPWDERKHLVMVAGNKYWKIRRTLLRGIAAKVRDVFWGNQERFSKNYAPLQLHDQRLAVIAHFGARSELDLFGNQWNDLRNLPAHWQKQLAHTMQKLKPTACDNKQEVIAGYRFSICFENIQFPGYVTEKIIDCLAAGVIPVYWGAPDIADFVPQDCYINAEKFHSLAALSDFLNSMTPVQGTTMISKGQAFLQEAKGRLFSYESFAEQMEQLLIDAN